jgi:hypothetical protein
VVFVVAVFRLPAPVLSFVWDGEFYWGLGTRCPRGGVLMLATAPDGRLRVRNPALGSNGGGLYVSGLQRTRLLNAAPRFAGSSRSTSPGCSGGGSDGLSALCHLTVSTQSACVAPSAGTLYSQEER